MNSANFSSTRPAPQLLAGHRIFARHQLASSAFRRGLRCVAMAASVVLSACASGYTQFYKPAEGASPQDVAAMRIAPPNGRPLVERAAPPASKDSALVDAYAKRGFELIGTSAFNSGRSESEDAAIQQAVNVGADLVLILDPKYAGSTTTALPLTVPTTTTSYSTGTAMAYGPAGAVSAYGSSRTTTYGTSTSVIPITVDHIAYGAGYFVKRKWAFGALWRDLNDAERQRLQSNKGVYVRVVIDDSPAYLADILVGDIILAIDGELVSNQRSLIELLRPRAGRSVMVSIFRNGTFSEKSVRMLPI